MSIIDFFKNRRNVSSEDNLPILIVDGIMAPQQTEKAVEPKYVLSDICFFRGQHLGDDEYAVIPFIPNKDDSKLKDVINDSIYYVPRRF